MSDPTCLFCKICSGAIPATRVYEDDIAIAFLDIHPVNPGHTLVVPRAHYPSTTETPDAIIQHMAVVTKHIARAMIAGLGITGYNIEVNSGAVAGQIIMHAHWHIVPRHADDGLKHWPGTTYEPGVDVQVAQKIRENINT